MAVFIQECREPHSSAPAVWMGSWGSAEHLWRKGCISIWNGLFSCWQMTVRSVLLRSTSYAFGLLLSCSTTGFSSSTFTLRAFFCWWYMPDKLNCLSQIKCISQSSKPRKSPASPQLVCCSDEFLLSPRPHTCTAPSTRSHSMSGLLPNPRILVAGLKDESGLWQGWIDTKNQSQPRCQFN